MAAGERIIGRFAPGLQPRLTFDASDDIAAPYINTGARPRVAILREQGFNSHIETAYGFDRAGFLEVLARFFDPAQLSSDWDSLKEADAELLVNSLSILCPFEPEERQALLEAPTLANRRETLETLMEFALRSGGDEGAIQ